MKWIDRIPQMRSNRMVSREFDEVEPVPQHDNSILERMEKDFKAIMEA